MLTNENANQLLELMCECEPNMKCVPCRVKERVNFLEKELEDMTAMKQRTNMYYKQNKAMKLIHQLHLDALNNYYHALHKCPCRDQKPGKCESQWQNATRTK